MIGWLEKSGFLFDLPSETHSHVLRSLCPVVCCPQFGLAVRAHVSDDQILHAFPFALAHPGLSVVVYD
jgi:hypothetical protein